MRKRRYSVRPSVVTSVNLKKSNLTPAIANCEILKISSSVVVPFIEINRSNSSTMPKLGITPRTKTASCAVSYKSVLSSRATEKKSNLVQVSFNLFLSSADISSIRLIIFLPERLMAENNGFSFWAYNVYNCHQAFHHKFSSYNSLGLLLSALILRNSRGYFFVFLRSFCCCCDYPSSSLLLLLVTRPLPRDGNMAEDHGAPEARQLPRVWTRALRETESRQRMSGVKSP